MTEQSTRVGRVGAAMHRKAKRFLKRFRLSREGGVAMIFGLSFIPLSMLTLTAIDFHRASTVRNTLQDALDAASLAAARSDSTNAATIQSIGYNALAANMTTFPDATVTKATFVLGSDGTVTGDAEATVSPLVSHMFIGGPIKVGADSQVVRANDKLEIALVLDNTGSMQGTKISTLRTAAANLVDDLKEAASKNPDPNAIKISLVPFSMTVRVGATYQSANWMDTTGVSPQHSAIFDGTANRFTMLSQMRLSWGGCVESRPQPYDVQETAPTASNPSTLFVPYFAPDEPDTPSISGWTNYDVDNNYLPDGISTKSADYKKWAKHQGRKAKYSTSGLSTTNNKGPNRGCNMQPLARLTTNMTAIKTSISNMVADGNTNIPMGLMWGWHTLTPNAPFGDGASYTDDEVTKVVILMTDGDNVNSEYDNPNDSTYSGLSYIGNGLLGSSVGVGSTASQRSTAMNNRLATLCTNMKAKGIVIYTVRVEVSGGASSLLQNCASKADYFYDVQNVADLGDAFEQIAGQISRLRIAH